MEDYISNNNKGMLWGILQENDIFANINNDKFNNIQSIFENTIQNIYNINRNVPLSLIEINKMTIETLIPEINKEKNKQSVPSNIQMIYKSEDLQKQRESNFNLKLKEQQDSLNTLINPKIPQEPNFNDVNINEDRPIGGEMDKLIAERMASRERELEVPKMSKEAENWVNNSQNIKLETVEKKVSFNDNHIINNINNNESNENKDESPKQALSNLLNKLKKKEMKDNKEDSIQDNKEDSIQDNKENNIQNSILKIEESINNLRENQEKLMDICTIILNEIKK
tara:strand:- start:110 stop:958 length:849 start_codon:yes stop_codon:yes gene_type:complete